MASLKRLGIWLLGTDYDDITLWVFFVILGLRQSAENTPSHKGILLSEQESATPDTRIMHRRDFKYRIYPTKSQIEFLTGQLRDACDLYNAALEERIGAWKLCRKSITVYDQQNQLPAMRADGCLNLVNAQCAQDVLRRLDKRFKGFFGRVRRGDKPGFPRYRPFHRYNSITFPSYGNGCRLLDNGKLRLQGAGHIKIKLHRPIEGKIKTSTIKREADRWFICFNIESSVAPLSFSQEGIGIDVGLNTFATLSNGDEIGNPRFYEKSHAKIRINNRRVKRRKNGSNRHRKAVRLLQRTHLHVKNQRADFHHKESRKIVNRFGLIAVEDLNMKGLVSGMLAKSVSDVGWSGFLRMISYKAEEAGRDLRKINPRGTSQTCLCGAAVPKVLKNRWHHCAFCGLSAGRDHVSAQVILQRARTEPSGVNVAAVSASVA